MKKIIGIGVGVLLLACVAFFFFSQHSRGKISIESVLPAQPVFYLRTTNLSSRIEKFTTTKFFRDFKSMDYKKFAGAMSVGPQAFDEAEKNLANVFSLENQKILKALFGQEFSLAVYSDDNLKDLQAKTPQEIQKVITQLAGNIFVATRVSSDFAATEIVLKFLGQFNKDFKTDTMRYNGKEINLISNKDSSLTLAYVRLDDILVMGIGEKAAKSAIDVFAKKQKALLGDAAFAKRMQKFSLDTHTVGFLDIHAISEMVSAQAAQMSKDPKTALYAGQMEDSLKQLKGLESLVFANSTTDVWTSKAGLYFDREKIDPSMKGFYSCAPIENHSAQFVPWDALYYQWSSCLDFPLMFQQYKEGMAAQGKATGRPIDINQMLSGYEKMLGLSIEGDVLPVLGKEFGIYLTDVDTTGNFPIPKIVVFVQITDREKATALINKLLALQPNLRPEEEAYQGEVIRFIPIPFVDSFKVGYTFADNYLLLASNVDILKASLEASKNPDKSIAINSALRSALGSKNSLFFVEFDRLMGKAGELVDWSTKMAQQAKVQRQAFITGSQKNLDGIKARNEELNTQLTTKKKNLLQVEATVDPTADLSSQKENLKKDIETVQKEIAANEQRAKNLSKQIKDYEARAPKEDADAQMAQEFLKPLLQALSNVKYFVTSTNNGDGVLESTTQLKVE